jgi:hypothetical protein
MEKTSKAKKEQVFCGLEPGLGSTTLERVGLFTVAWATYRGWGVSGPVDHWPAKLYRNYQEAHAAAVEFNLNLERPKDSARPELACGTASNLNESQLILGCLAGHLRARGVSQETIVKWISPMDCP